MAKGVYVTHRDGSTSFLAKEDLNIPKWNFWRLYYQRMHGRGPAKHSQGNGHLGTFNRWLRGLGADEPNFSVDWEWRIFCCLNKTLGYEPSDPKFVVRVQAQSERRYYRREDLSRSERTIQSAVLEWKDEWMGRWNDGIF